MARLRAAGCRRSCSPASRHQGRALGRPPGGPAGTPPPLMPSTSCLRLSQHPPWRRPRQCWCRCRRGAAQLRARCRECRCHPLQLARCAARLRLEREPARAAVPALLPRGHDTDALLELCPPLPLPRASPRPQPTAARGVGLRPWLCRTHPPIQLLAVCRLLMSAHVPISSRTRLASGWRTPLPCRTAPGAAKW